MVPPMLFDILRESDADQYSEADPDANPDQPCACAEPYLDAQTLLHLQCGWHDHRSLHRVDVRRRTTAVGCMTKASLSRGRETAVE